MKHFILVILLLTVSVTACKRNNIRGDLKNRREILQSSNWKLIKITANGGPTSLPECQQDNYYVFTPGGSGSYEEGENNCLDSTGTGNAPTHTSFLWQMTGDLRYLYLLNYAGDPGRRIEWEIRNMTFEQMDVRQFVKADGIDVRLDMSYKAIPK